MIDEWIWRTSRFEAEIPRNVKTVLAATAWVLRPSYLCRRTSEPFLCVLLVIHYSLFVRARLNSLSHPFNLPDDMNDPIGHESYGRNTCYWCASVHLFVAFGCCLLFPSLLRRHRSSNAISSPRVARLPISHPLTHKISPRRNPTRTSTRCRSHLKTPQREMYSL